MNKERSDSFGKHERSIDSPNGYCVIDVLLCMIFIHSADLSF